MFIVFASLFSKVHAQINDSIVVKCFNALKKSKVYAFSYSISSKFPDGTSERTVGEVYVNDQQQLMYNHCNGQTMIYNGTWFYKADHVAKEIGIISLRALDSKTRSGFEENIFNNSSVNKFIDSFLIKSASIKKATYRHDTAIIELKFPQSSYVSSIQFTFDKTHNELVNYVMTTYQKWPTNQFGFNKGTTEIITYDKVSINDIKSYNIDEYFSYANKKIELKKYKQYKLETKL